MGISLAFMPLEPGLGPWGMGHERGNEAPLWPSMGITLAFMPYSVGGVREVRDRPRAGRRLAACLRETRCGSPRAGCTGRWPGGR